MQLARLAIVAAVFGAACAVWAAAGRMHIQYASDVDAHVQEYQKGCDQIAMQYLGQKNQHVTLRFDQYKDMISRLKSCNAHATPAIVKR
jgi:hypothetical protein